MPSASNNDAIDRHREPEPSGAEPMRSVYKESRDWKGADISQVQVLHPARWRRATGEAQGRRREVESEGSVEQSRGGTCQRH